MIRIVLVEDHDIVREGVAALVQSVPGMQLVGLTGDGGQAVDLVEREMPDLVVLDLSLPGLDGLEVMRRIHHRHPRIGLVVLSMHDQPQYIAEARRNGSRAYVLKEDSFEVLREAIETVHAGGTFFSPRLDIPTDAEDRTAAGADERFELLSARERDVLHLVAQGLTSDAIAERLFISVRTVETHRTNLMAKLGIRNQTGLVHFALQRGLVPLMKGSGP